MRRWTPSIAGAAVAMAFCSSAMAWPGPGPGPGWRPGEPWWPGPFGPVIVLSPEPVIYPPPVPAVPAPQVQVWVEKKPHFRYYCPESQGFYPQVPRCPKGWMKVVEPN